MEKKKTRELDNGITVIDLGYRNSAPVALVEKSYEKYDNDYLIVFNYKVKDNNMEWGYSYNYGRDIEKAKKDFADVLAGKSLADTFKNINFIDDEEKMQDFYRLSKDEFLSLYSYLSEQEYENTKQYVLENRNHYVSRVKEYLIEDKNIMSLPVRYFENNKWDTKNIFVYLAEQYNIEIPDNAKNYISKNLVFYLQEEKNISVMDRENEEKVDILPYLEQIKEKVKEEHSKLKKKNKERGR